MLVFRKKGINPIPIEHPTGLSEYAGSREMPKELLSRKDWTGKQIENYYSHWIWRQYASAFWDDIRINNAEMLDELTMDEMLALIKAFIKRMEKLNNASNFNVSEIKKKLDNKNMYS